MDFVDNPVTQKSALKVFWPALFVLFLDQTTKHWVRATMRVGESHPVWGDFFRISHVENTGVAFGLQPAGVPLLALFSALASVGLVVLLLRSRRGLTSESP